MSLAVIFVVAHMVGPTELGTVALALGIVQMLGILIDTLLHDAIVQRHRLDDDHLDTAFWTCLGFGLSCAALCWAAAPAFAAIFATPAIAPLLSVGAIGLIFVAIGTVPLAVLRRGLAFKPIAVRSLYARLAGAAAAFATLALGYGLWCIVVQYLVQQAVNAALVWPACAWRPKLRFSLRRLGQLIAFGAISVGTRIVWLSSMRLFMMLIGYFIGVTAVGYLNIAQRVVDTLYDILAGAAYNLALPLFSRHQKSPASLVQAFRAASEFGALAIPPIFIGLAVCAAPVVSLLLGDEWLPAVPLIQILSIGAVVQFVLLFANTAVTASGRPGLIFCLSLCSFAFVIGAFLLLQPADAFEAASIWVGRLLLTGPLVLIIVWHYLGAAPVGVLRDILPPLGIAAAMAAALVALEHEFLNGQSALSILLVLVPLGAAIYGIGVAVACRESVRRLIVLVMSGLRKTGAA